MKTITFYSYKGGVGRSLALSNIAIRLSQLNKKVCVIDFDLDAPGLRFKFSDYTIKSPIQKGIVDYVYMYSNEGIVPPNIADFVTEFKSNSLNSGPIHFISAGNIESNEYWKKLSMIKWAEMFYSETSKGIRFFLDLKAKIEKEINPDILLIDSRTGITDISGITLRLFADEIVILAVNNKENMFGTKKILKSLLKPEHTFLNKSPKINFVLTRLPFSNTPQDKAKEFALIQEKKNEFGKDFEIENFEISVIHSDRSLEEKERHLIGISYNENEPTISNDYLKLFDLLTADILTLEETERFKNLKFAELEYSRAFVEGDLAKRLVYLDKAINLNDKQFQFFLLRGTTKWQLERMTEAIDDFLNALDLNPSNPEAKYSLGVLYYNINDIEESIRYLDQVSKYPNAIIVKSVILLNLNKLDECLSLLNRGDQLYPNNDAILNAKADLLRRLRSFDDALYCVYKAIEINPVQPSYFATLAEINFAISNIEGFYLNLNIALSKGLTANDLSTAIEVYGELLNEKRFIVLMDKYQIKIQDIVRLAQVKTITLR